MPTSFDPSPEDWRPPTSPPEDEGLDRALRDGLDVPLLALRASMESLQRQLDQRHDGRPLLSAALEQIDRIERNVREVMEYVHRPEPRPLRCTTSEIMLAARHGLVPRDRGRVLLASEVADEYLHTDAPLLSRGLQRLLERALRGSSDEVLLVARSTRERGVVFHLLERVGRTRSSGLELAITARDVDLLGGTLDFECCPGGSQRITLTVPRGATPGTAKGVAA